MKQLPYAGDANRKKALKINHYIVNLLGKIWLKYKESVISRKVSGIFLTEKGGTPSRFHQPTFKSGGEPV